MSKQNGKEPGNGHEAPLTPVEDFKALRLHGKAEALESSGRVVRWRPVNLTRMLKAGKVPDHLTAFVTTIVWSGNDEDERPAVKQAIEWQDYLDWMASQTLIAPSVAYGETAGDILPDDLFHEELLELDAKARKPLEAVRPFRAEQIVDVDNTQEGKRVEQAA